MPSGRTHDAITFLLAMPAAAIGYMAATDYRAGVIVGITFIFGGLVFGPDLDTVSRQYTRWSVFRFFWFPYRSFFPHRSRFSHGLIFGALIRVIYLMGTISLVALIFGYVYATYSNGRIGGFTDLVGTWRRVGTASRDTFGYYFPLHVFLGIWLGAASHTFTDMAGSFIKTGRIAKFL